MNVRSKYRLGAALVGALAVSALLSGCVNNANFLDPQGPVSLQESYLFWFIFYVATFVFIAVTAVLLVSIWRFRARPGMPAPRQLHGNTTIEIVWTVVPSVILFAVLAFTIYTLFNIGEPAGQRALTVNVYGHQWWWEFQYPDSGNFATADDMHIPVGAVVHVNLHSNNVIHSFWVPSLSGKMDVIPGQLNQTWLKADKAGTYRGECTEYCGEQHAHMNFQVIADDPGAFASWVSSQQAAAAAPSGAAAAGQAVFNAHACWSCHPVNQPGIQRQPPNAIAPNLTHFASREYIAGLVLPRTDANLKQWIAHNQSVKPGNDMTEFNLSDTDMNNLIAYLDSLT
jgi:cytochrome c oxidase subunit 2